MVLGKSSCLRAHAWDSIKINVEDIRPFRPYSNTVPHNSFLGIVMFM